MTRIPMERKWNLTKQQLIEEERKDRKEGTTRWQVWADYLLGDEKTDSLVTAIESRSGRIIEKSDSKREDLTVDLESIARFLRLNIGTFYTTGRRSAHLYKTSIQEEWAGKGRWTADIKYRTKEQMREGLAHELGHAIIYQGTGTRVYDYEWRSCTNSLWEERIAEYCARLILLPEDFVRHQIKGVKKDRMKKKLAWAGIVHKSMAELRLKELGIDYRSYGNNGNRGREEQMRLWTPDNK